MPWDSPIASKSSLFIVVSDYYTIMANECTDKANKKPFLIGIRWLDSQLDDHEDVIGLYAFHKIDSESSYKAIKDVQLRMNLSISKCRGQCYDGAANMIGSKTVVATRIQAEGRAILTHCYGHALNLAVGNTISSLSTAGMPSMQLLKLQS